MRKSVYGPLGSFDHPVPSLFATGLAHALGRPVETTVADPDDDRYDALVVCTWGERDADEDADDERADDEDVDDESADDEDAVDEGVAAAET